MRRLVKAHWPAQVRGGRGGEGTPTGTPVGFVNRTARFLTNIINYMVTNTGTDGAVGHLADIASVPSRPGFLWLSVRQPILQCTR